MLKPEEHLLLLQGTHIQSPVHMCALKSAVTPVPEDPIPFLVSVGMVDKYTLRYTCIHTKLIFSQLIFLVIAASYTNIRGLVP